MTSNCEPTSFLSISLISFPLLAEPPFPLLSLGVLVPPLRMMSALMWQVVRLGNISQYGKLEEFVSMVTEAVPDLLSNRQRWLLTLALRGRVRDFLIDCKRFPACFESLGFSKAQCRITELAP
jgi:hypothetical protein